MPIGYKSGIRSSVLAYDLEDITLPDLLNSPFRRYRGGQEGGREAFISLITCQHRRVRTTSFIFLGLGSIVYRFLIRFTEFSFHSFRLLSIGSVPPPRGETARNGECAGRKWKGGERGEGEGLERKVWRDVSVVTPDTIACYGTMDGVG